MSNITINSIGFLCILVLVNGLNFCGDWIQYKNSKCYKLLNRKDTAYKALAECHKINNNSFLATVVDQDQQNFINELLKPYANVSMFAWIGMKWNNNTYQWMDGSDSEYTNWSDEAVRTGEDPCVKVSLMRGMFGKWVDSSCNRRALIVCQRKPELSLNSLKDIIQNVSQNMDKYQENIMKIIMTQIIPIGFLYTQLPNQSSPQLMWPNLVWTEVSKEYAGLFFRVEGIDSAPFGELQLANQSTISTIRVDRGSTYSNLKQVINNEENKRIFEGWNNFYGSYDIRGLGFHITKGEVRPINTAVKIWKRTG